MGMVVYLTGAPATGKSSLGSALVAHVPGLRLFSYSQELRDHIRSEEKITEVDIRRQSSALVTPEHVMAVDNNLLRIVAAERQFKSIVIDSHAVTKEPYGFRVTPFSISEITELAPDAIVCLYAAPQVIVQRILEDPAGRPLVTIEQARMHCDLQNALAMQYAVMLGKPCYLFDSSVEKKLLIDLVISKLKLN